MQYLAEVQKKSGGLLGASKVELRLIACQRSEDNWQAMAGSNVVTTDKANDFSSGSLVIADVAGNDVKRVNAATQPVLKILQHYSRLQEKLKDKDDDIEQWKQSLTYQSQELNRRVMEVEVREEELQQAGEELARLEQQRNEVNALREEAQRAQAEIEAKNQEIAAAWAQLNQEKQSLEGRLQEGQSGGSLDEAQVQALEQQLSELALIAQDWGEIQPKVVALSDRLETQQPLLDQYWQQLEAGGNSGVDGAGAWQAWSESLAALEAAKGELVGLQRELVAKRQACEALQRQLKANNLLRQQLTHMAGGLDPDLAAQIDYGVLEAMSLEELEAKVQERQKDYDRTFNFVNDQEEELRLQQQAIEELKVKISQASEFDRLTLETELADEQESYSILDDSMFDQRRTLSERRVLLNEYQKILARRQGQASEEGGPPAIDFSPVLTQVDADVKQQTQQLEELKTELQAVEAKTKNLELEIAAKTEEQGRLRQQAESSGGDAGDPRPWLTPIQDMVNSLREQLQALHGDCQRLQEARDRQLQLVNEMNQMLTSFNGQVQLSAAA